MSPEGILVDAIKRRLTTSSARPLVVGLCGAQGSGKSTVAAALTTHFDRCVTFSIDDLYLGRAAREALAKRIHPLLATRGVPGTHDPLLGVEVLEALKRGRSVAIPRFDKASDDRMPLEEWQEVEPDRKLVIFEGWCVGALPQQPSDLIAPVNFLEAEEDSDGRWRRFVNDQLGGAYQQLFSCIDMLVLLAAPSWETILGWRLQQEHELRASCPDGTGLMEDHQVARFVSHYERLTRHILAEMPARADLVIYLNQCRESVGAEFPVEKF